MSRWLNLQLLLLCFISYIESSGNIPLSVTGEKGSNITLPCEFEDRIIFHIDLIKFSKIIPVRQNEEYKSENDRVFKKGACDVVIKDLRFSDAGKYTLRVHYKNNQTMLEQQEYHLHIHDEISVKTGEELKMDVLLINADKVEKNSSGEWTEVWTRGHGVRSDRLNISDETLIIKEFTVTDSGTYRVLDYEENILITVTVTESNNTDKDKTDDTEHHTVGYWIVAVVLTVIVTAVVLLKHLLRDHVQCVTRRRKEELRSGDPEALKVYEDLCQGPVEHHQTLQGSGHTVTSLDNIYIYIYSFGRRFYPKRLTSEDNTGIHHTTFKI